VLALAILRFVW